MAYHWTGKGVQSRVFIRFHSVHAVTGSWSNGIDYPIASQSWKNQWLEKSCDHDLVWNSQTAFCPIHAAAFDAFSQSVPVTGWHRWFALTVPLIHG